MRRHPHPYHLVIGLGASGLSMARFLHAAGKSVIATDIDEGNTHAAEVLGALGIETQIGFHDQAVFDNAHCLVPSPGIPLTSKFIAAAMEKGVPVIGELDIFSDENRLPVIAVTGTNGKTTTTTLIGDLLTACGKKPFVGGNIGTPLVELLMNDEAYDTVVAEVSSFQLDLSKRFRPDVALLLNISEDHMDRYPTFADYENAKWHIFKQQTPHDTAVINAAISDAKTRSKELAASVLWFSSFDRGDDGIHARVNDREIRFNLGNDEFEIDTTVCPALHGTHNHENIAAAVLACVAAGTDINHFDKGLTAFTGLPHRVEKVRHVKGVTFYNDSKATNTDAVIRALECFDQPVILILGGREKGTDFSQLTGAVRKHVKAIMAIGESRRHIRHAFSDICPVTEAGEMKDAVIKAFEKARTGDIVLLSPACASFDMYDNYGHRGDDFKSIVSGIGTN